MAVEEKKKSGEVEDGTSFTSRLRRLVVGRPRDLSDRTVFHQISLVAFLAWVGLGADGLSSSAYGPEEAFRTLGQHTYLAIPLALVMALTVIVISAAYSRIIEYFPHGGGGYVVATKLLGEKVGVVSGCALLVDYVLTITISVAAAADASFSLAPASWLVYKVPVEAMLIVMLMVMNLRGVKESVMILTPIFIVFVLTHAALILGAIGMHVGQVPELAHTMSGQFKSGATALGVGGMIMLFIHAYSLGGGTYTGIEAVSNGLPIMREPRVKTAKRTMFYMAASLAFTAAGLVVAYLLLHVAPTKDKTMNAVLLESFAGGSVPGRIFIVVTLLSEGLLLVVAAQAGFIDGPRVLANMAVDSWVPRRFAALSERLTTQNGIVLMTIASLAALVYTKGSVQMIVVMYSINVFVTFSLSMFGMLTSSMKMPSDAPKRRSGLLLFGTGFLFCGTILVITVLEKFKEGGWLTLLVTGLFVGLCFLIKKHYRRVAGALAALDTTAADQAASGSVELGRPDPSKPTACVLVGSYSGLGVHTVKKILATFPGHFKNLVFVSVGVIDSGEFKGEAEMAAMKTRTDETLRRYCDLARRMGAPAAYRSGIGTDVVAEAESLCLAVSKEFPQTTFFAGQVIFEKEQWYHRMLHNETAFAVQKRLQWAGQTMVILPAKVA